jgi:chromosome segregation ATPase
MLCTCAFCAPFTGGASLAGLTLSAGTCSALAVGGAFIVGQDMDQKDKENELKAQALNNQSSLINSNNQELIRMNNTLNEEKKRRQEAEDGIKENQNKLDDPNASEEEKKQAQAKIAFFQQQLDNSNQKITSLSSEISGLTRNIKDLNNLSK